MGDTPNVFVPMTMKAEIRPGITDLLDRTSRWLNIVGKLKPGLSREQAEAGINPLWYSIRADELKQRGHSSDHFKESFLTKSHLFVRDGAKGFSPLRSRRAAAAAHHHGDGRTRGPDGLRQRRQPLTGAGCGAYPRNVCPVRARGQARASRATVAGRRPVCLAWRAACLESPSRLAFRRG